VAGEKRACVGVATRDSTPLSVRGKPTRANRKPTSPGGEDIPVVILRLLFLSVPPLFAMLTAFDGVEKSSLRSAMLTQPTTT
jgi:hypothetical protein